MRALATVLLCLVAYSCGTVTPCGGCIDKDGVCQAGAARTACGSNGATCLNCAFASQTCSAGACVAADAGVGGGSAGGGRAGGAAGGGFVAAGGSAGGSSIPDGSVQVTFEWDGLDCQTIGCPDCSIRQCRHTRVMVANLWEVERANTYQACDIGFDGGATASVNCSGRCTLTSGMCSVSPDAGRPSMYGTCNNIGSLRNDCNWQN